MARSSRTGMRELLLTVVIVAALVGGTTFVVFEWILSVPPYPHALSR